MKKQYRWSIVGITLLLLAFLLIKGIGALAYAHKVVRETTGTVVRKEKLLFNEANRVYIDEGVRVERQAGDEEWRIYYRIDNFDQITSSIKNKLSETEQERITKGNYRFRIVSRDQYNYIQVGDKLSVGWRWCGENQIEVVTAGKPR
jgi:hypothetical protein